MCKRTSFYGSTIYVLKLGEQLFIEQLFIHFTFQLFNLYAKRRRIFKWLHVLVRLITDLTVIVTFKKLFSVKKGVM